MFSYYGSKSKIVGYYPKPEHNKIIEPFAGSARYSLKYWENDITISDKYEKIISIWQYIQNCSISDIDRLPKLQKGETLDNFNFDCIEQKWLMGFIIQAGVNAPRLTCTEAGVRNQVTAINNIKRDLHKIKHWKIIHSDYTDLPNERATWFIDPPYQFGGKYYIHKNIDYQKLKEWVLSRNGNVILCENTKATWIDTIPIKRIQGLAQTNTTESVWLSSSFLQ
jgi:site-specific DNA-adenine methylase